MPIALKNLKYTVWPVLLGMALGGSILYGLHIWNNFEINISRKPHPTSQRYHFKNPPIIEFSGERFAILALNDHKSAARRSLVIKSLRDQKISNPKVGSSAFKGAKIIKITRDCITLEDSRRTIVISLPQSTPSGSILNRIM